MDSPNPVHTNPGNRRARNYRPLVVNNPRDQTGPMQNMAPAAAPMPGAVVDPPQYDPVSPLDSKLPPRSPGSPVSPLKQPVSPLSPLFTSKPDKVVLNAAFEKHAGPTGVSGTQLPALIEACQTGATSQEIEECIHQVLRAVLVARMFRFLVLLVGSLPASVGPQLPLVGPQPPSVGPQPPPTGPETPSVAYD